MALVVGRRVLHRRLDLGAPDPHQRGHVRGRPDVPLQVPGVGQRGGVGRVLGEDLVVEHERRLGLPLVVQRQRLLELLLDQLGLRERHAARRRLAGLAGLDEVRHQDDATGGDEEARRDDADDTPRGQRSPGGGRAPSPPAPGPPARGPTRRARPPPRPASPSPAPPAAEWSSSERSPASCSRSASASERRRKSRSSLRYQRSSRWDRSRRFDGSVDRHDTCSSSLRASKARLRRQKTTPTPDQGGGTEHQGDDPDERDATRVGRHEQDGLAVLGHQGLVDVGGRAPRSHHALDLVTHGDGGRRVRLGHREVGARGAAHRGLDGGGALRRGRRRRVEDAAADHQGDGERRPGGGPRGPTGARRSCAQPFDVRACCALAARRKESRFAWVAGPRSTAVTRPDGSTMNVVGGAVTP